MLKTSTMTPMSMAFESRWTREPLEVHLLRRRGPPLSQAAAVEALLGGCVKRQRVKGKRRKFASPFFGMGTSHMWLSTVVFIV